MIRYDYAVVGWLSWLVYGVVPGAVGHGSFEGGRMGRSIIRTHACVLILYSVCKGEKMRSRNKYQVAVLGGL